MQAPKATCLSWRLVSVSICRLLIVMKVILFIFSIIVFGCQVEDRRERTSSPPENVAANEVNEKIDRPISSKSIYGIWQIDSKDSLATKFPTLYITEDSGQSLIGSVIDHRLFDDTNKIYVGRAFYYGSTKQIEAYAYSVVQFQNRFYTCQLYGNTLNNSEVIDWCELSLTEGRLKFNNYSSLDFVKMSDEELENPFLEIISLFHRDNKYTDIRLAPPTN